MWQAKLTRREFIEICFDERSLQDRAHLANFGIGKLDIRDGEVFAYWESRPSPGEGIPALAIVPDAELPLLVTTINASPQAPNPITAICRIISHSEALALTEAKHTSSRFAASFVALAMAEALLHAGAPLPLGQVSPSYCKRTLSYAWGKAMAHPTASSLLNALPSRWLEAYAIINSQHIQGPARTTAVVSSMIAPLAAATALSCGLPAGDAPTALAIALGVGDLPDMESAWKALSRDQGLDISIEQLASMTREDRGSYLQAALKQVSAISPESGADANRPAAIAAFLATQVAPGTLEHLELLREYGHASLLGWYALYAVLLAPSAVMAGQRGLGLRILRDITNVPMITSRPTADVAYSELRVLERAGLDNLARKLGHASEIEVEIIPFVTCSFTFQSRSARGRGDSYVQSPQMQLFDGPDEGYRPDVSTKVRIKALLSSLSQLVQELPDQNDESKSPGPKRTRRN
jgi:hypothetical protein